ncbi:uridine kinase [Acaromyces ingoldii]|uniref:Uridine kinase n=1 Tax=Acaromyces ingoldii TaxID=215250 RepID=A0A316YQZ7_9BASI|nr:uridine kinase [Acaromyces ingoldii]PWN91234.1 uridine kinase [Acaromyces ingoldii]
MASKASVGTALHGSQSPGGGTKPTTQTKNVVLTEAGRAPWYDANGRPLDAYIVGVAGGSASGKTSVAKAILRSLPNVPWVAIVSQDSFYKTLTREQSKMAFENNYDFDHPNAFDYDIFHQCVSDLKQSRAVEIPVYSFVEHQRTADKTYLYGAVVVIVEGIFVLHNPALRSLLDLKIFVQADSDLMLARRIRRDIVERGRDVAGILDQYLRFVKPSMDNFVSQTSKFADIIVPGQNNDVAIDVISQQIKNQLESRAMKLRHELSRTPATPRRELLVSPLAAPGGSLSMSRAGSRAGETLGALRRPDLERWTSYSSNSSSSSSGAGPAMLALAEASQDAAHPLEEELPSSVCVLPQTPQLRGLLTIMHDLTVTGADFIFTVDRLSTLVMEAAMAFLPYKDKEITLKGGRKHMGTEMDVQHICSVSILRSGSVLEASARRAIPALARGSVLIQSSDDDGEPKLYNVSLPSFVRNRQRAANTWAIILDSQIGTGAAALMAIRVLLDHGVQEHHIVFCCLLVSAKGGVHALHRAFPKVHVVTAGVDAELKRRRVRVDDGNAVAWRGGSEASTIGTIGGQGRARRGGKGRGFSSSGISDDDEEEDDGHPDDSLEHDDGRYEQAGRITRLNGPGKSEGAARRRTRICFAIEPGAGNIGDRYYGTKVRPRVMSTQISPQVSRKDLNVK